MIEERKHLEADLLAAFAENALSRDEREMVLMHLADCKDCRELLYLAQDGLPEEQVVTVAPQVQSRQWWFTWRSALVAACLLVTVSVVTWQVYLRMQPASEMVAKVTHEAPVQQTMMNEAVKNSSVSPQETKAAIAPVAKSVTTSESGAGGDFRKRSQSPQRAAAGSSFSYGAGNVPTTSGQVTTQPEVAQSPVPESYKVLAPHPLISDEHKMSDAELAQRHQLHQLQAAEVRHQDAISSASLSAAVAPQQKAMRKESFDAAAPVPSATGTSGGAVGYAPPSSASGFTATWDRSALPTQGASANSYEIARPSKLPGGSRELNRVTVGTRQLALDESGRLFVSTDQGASWREIHKQWSGNATMLMVAPKGSPVAASQGGSGDVVELWNAANQAWMSTDGGESWKPFVKQAKPVIQLDQSTPQKPQ
jgi:hypothetical protein